jgi:hypothetical protein
VWERWCDKKIQNLWKLENGFSPVAFATWKILKQERLSKSWWWWKMIGRVWDMIKYESDWIELDVLLTLVRKKKARRLAAIRAPW